MKCKIGRREIDRLKANGGWLSDTLVRGFLARRLPSGRVQYCLRYRVNGGRHTLPLGLDGEVTPEKARTAAEIARGQLKAGTNPAAERREKLEAEAEAASSAAETFKAVAALYIEREAKPKLRSAREVERIFRFYCEPRLGAKPISEIRRRDIVEMLDHVEDNNGAVMADRVLAAVRRLCNWHATRDDQFVSPVVRGMARTKPKERARDRMLSDPEIRALWCACDAVSPPAFGAMVRLLLLTAQRLGEVRLMRWSEIEGGDWTIPAERYKTKRAVIVPLSEDARTILEALPRVGGFALTTGSTTSRPKRFEPKEVRPLGALGKAKAALDVAMLAELQRHDLKIKLQPWVIHDLRRTARSLMSRAGVRPDIAERVLGHVIAGVAGVYDRHDYKAEKRQALEALATELQQIVSPPDGARVVPMRRKERPRSA